MTLPDRFWAKVTKTEACWLWTGALSHGYGSFSLGGRKIGRAHRFAYELLVGPIPEGLVLDHLCREPRCVNPDHLEPVTHRENTLRGTTRAACNAVKTECKQGHPFDEANTWVYEPTGARQCRTCRNARQRDYKRRKRANRGR